MPKMTPHPVPKKRYHGARWRIYWKWNTKQYSVATDFFDAKKVVGVDSDLRLIAAALVVGPEAFPEKYRTDPAVVRYIEERYGHPSPSSPTATVDTASEMLAEDWLSAYEKFALGNSGSRWGKISVAVIRRLAEFTPGGLGGINPALAEQFLDDILAHRKPRAKSKKTDDSAKKGNVENEGNAKKNSPGTRNRVLAICNRCFRWAVRTERASNNPFAGIPRLPEPRQEEIVYCTRAERDHLIQLAKEIDLLDWIAVPIAFYAGLRMEEIFRMRWTDIRWDSCRLVVPVSKTKKSRTLELNSNLMAMLKSIRGDKTDGYVVPEVEGAASRRDRAQTILRMLKRAEKNRPHGDGTPPPVPAERIRWNAWRHTFASLLVQSGVSLDIVSAWMGNTPEVCRRHYAQFMPRDSRNAAIDML